LHFDPLASRFRDIGIVMETDIVSLEEIKSIYGKDDKGYTGKAGEVKEEKIESYALSQREAIKHIVDGQYSGITGKSETEDLKDSAVVKEVYVRPSRKYPRG